MAQPLSVEGNRLRPNFLPESLSRGRKVVNGFVRERAGRSCAIAMQQQSTRRPWRAPLLKGLSLDGDRTGILSARSDYRTRFYGLSPAHRGNPRRAPTAVSTLRPPRSRSAGGRGRASSPGWWSRFARGDIRGRVRASLHGHFGPGTGLHFGPLLADLRSDERAAARDRLGRRRARL